MGNSISKNYIYNLSYQILTLLTPLLTTPYIARVIGPEGIGIYSYTTSVVAYFLLIGSLGLTNYGQREIAYFKGNTQEQSRVFYEVEIARIIMVSVSILLYYFFVLRYAKENYLIFLIQMINIFSLLFDSSWFFQGLEEFDKIVIRNLIIRIFSIILLFLLITCSDDLWLYVLINSSLTFLGNLLVFMYLPRYLIRVPTSSINPFRNWKIILELFLPQIAIQVYTVLDKTMIGICTSLPVENGYYEQSEKCIRMALMVVTSLGAVMMPRIASYFAKRDFNSIRSAIRKSFQSIWFLSIPMILYIIVLSPNFIPWFLGPGYDKVIILLQLSSLLIIPIGLSNVIGIQYLVATNQQNKMTFSVICGAFFNFIINMLLIPKYMSVGATISSILSETIVTVIQFYLVRSIFNIKDITTGISNYLTSGIVSFFVMILSTAMIEPGAISTIVAFALGSFFYLYILFLKKDPLVNVFFNKYLQRFI